MDIKVKYHDEEMPELEVIDGGDWVDVRAKSVKVNGVEREFKEGKPITYSAGDVVMVDLGISIELPEGHEAILAPRSSTFKNFGLIQTNGFGVIDESYCGDDDVWKQMFYALRPGKINRFDRVGQFKVQEKMKDIKFKKVKKLGNKNRGGFGSTGVK